METNIKIYVIEMITFEVEYKNNRTIRNFLGKKAIMADRNRDSAEKTIEKFTKSENENREEFKEIYHLEFDYMLQEVSLY